MRPLDNVLGVLDVARGPDIGTADEHWAFCPAHDDRNTPNLHVTESDDGGVLLHCFAGCAQAEVLSALKEKGIHSRDLFAREASYTAEGDGGDPFPVKPSATPQPHSANGTGKADAALQRPGYAEMQPCTLANYAAARELPESFLRDLGLSTIAYMGAKAVRVPYLTEDGGEGAVRVRVALEKDDHGGNRFRWRKGSKPTLYGLWRMGLVREAGYVVLVEGESDCHTLWRHGIDALGIPGASTWKEAWAEHLEGVGKVYAVIEPDGGGDTFREALTSTPALRDRLRLVTLDGAEDVSDLHLADPATFKEKLRTAFTRSVLWSEVERSQSEAEARRVWESCGDLAGEGSILDRFADELRRSGVAGESRTAKLLYLALTSRLLERPVSVAVKGPSSGGKTYLVERVLAYFPDSAYYALTAMSERTLAYSEEPIRHRFLVIYEAEGMSGDFATYLMRSLLSEGRVRYETVESTPQGIKPRLIEREGPTGLVITTTAVRLHPENETRLLSLTVTDTRDQTRDVIRALARPKTEQPDLMPWLALQEWLQSAESSGGVGIPYAEHLAELVPPVAVRLRRDFGAVLNLVRAHAVLHRATRQRDAEGNVLATVEDYAAVHALVADLVSEGVEATVPKTVYETVAAVKRLLEAGEGEPVNTASVARELRLDKSAAHRRVRAAIDRGYLRNLEDRKGRPARIVCGDPLAADVDVLPSPERLTERYRGCTVAAEEAGRYTPPPPEHHDRNAARRVQFTI